MRGFSPKFGTIKFTTKFVKNIDKFQNSIALIASKVKHIINYEASSLGEGKVVFFQDNEIINSIAHFIEEVRQNLVQNAILSDISDKEKTNAIKFLDTLLVKDGEVYPKIGLFRSPNKEGPLSNITLLQENKKHVEAILEKLSFAEKIDDDFGYTIPKDSLYDISGVMEELNQNILTNIRASGEKIKKHFSTKEETIHDIKDLYNEMRSGYETLLAIKHTAQAMEPKECIQYIKNHVTSIVISNSINQTLSNAINYGDYLEFLQTISGQNNSLKCSEGLENVKQYLDHSQKWYHFLLGLYDQLSKCYVLQNISMYDITNLIGKEDEHKKVIETSLEQFLQKIYQKQHYLEYNDIKDITLDKFKLESLKQVSNSTLNYQVKNPSCSLHNVTIANNKSVTDLYDPLGFINELQGLEDQFYKLHKELSFLPFYKSLLYRISQYEKKHHDTGESTAEDRKVLNYLYTTTLSKIYYINNNPEHFLVIDVKGYFDLIAENIKEYKKVLKEVHINKYQEEYSTIINTQITEANNLIEEEILPEIENIIRETDEKINLLVNETTIKQENAQKEQQDLRERQNKLEGQLLGRIALGVLQVGGQALALAGPVGAAAGAAIGGASTLIQTFAYDDTNSLGADKITQLPAGVGKSVTKIIDHYKSKQVFLKLKVEKVKTELDNMIKKESRNHDLQEVSRAISEYQEHIKNEDKKNSVGGAEYSGKRQELLKLLQTKQEELENEKTVKDKNTEKNLNIENKLRIYMHIQLAVSGVESVIDTVSRYQNDNAKPKQVTSALQNANNKIEALKQYEENIYKIIIPMIHSMHDITEDIKAQNGKSHAALDVSKWKIQSVIKDVQVEIQEMTEGFNVQPHLVRCIEKFEYGMLTMIQLYDRIQAGCDKKQLADLITNVVSDTTLINDTVLGKEINALELKIKSNLVLQEYNQVMSAFKQYIFPFANKYLSKFELQNTQHDTSALIDETITQITNIKNELTKDKVVIDAKQYQNMYPKAVFHSKDLQGPGPFFVWKHEISQPLPAESR